VSTIPPVAATATFVRPTSPEIRVPSLRKFAPPPYTWHAVGAQMSYRLDRGERAAARPSP
jgi:hypothetical protein